MATIHREIAYEYQLGRIYAVEYRDDIPVAVSAALPYNHGSAIHAIVHGFEASPTELERFKGASDMYILFEQDTIDILF